MGLRQPPFRYPLEPVLTRRRWALEALTLELAAARRELAQRERACERLQRERDAVNASLAALRTAGATLDLARERRLADYRAAQDEAVAHEAAHVQAARQACERLGERLAAARLALDALESHRGRLLGAHAREAQRAADRDADDAWLRQRHRQEVVS